MQTTLVSVEDEERDRERERAMGRKGRVSVSVAISLACVHTSTILQRHGPVRQQPYAGGSGPGAQVLGSLAGEAPSAAGMGDKPHL